MSCVVHTCQVKISSYDLEESEMVNKMSSKSIFFHKYCSLKKALGFFFLLYITNRMLYNILLVRKLSLITVLSFCKRCLASAVELVTKILCRLAAHHSKKPWRQSVLFTPPPAITKMFIHGFFERLRDRKTQCPSDQFISAIKEKQFVTIYVLFFRDWEDWRRFFFFFVHASD